MKLHKLIGYSLLYVGILSAAAFYASFTQMPMWLVPLFAVALLIFGAHMTTSIGEPRHTTDPGTFKDVRRRLFIVVSVLALALVWGAFIVALLVLASGKLAEDPPHAQWQWAELKPPFATHNSTVELGFRSDGVVVWRKVEQNKTVKFTP